MEFPHKLYSDPHLTSTSSWNCNHGGGGIFPNKNDKEQDQKLIVKLKLASSHENCYEGLDLKQVYFDEILGTSNEKNSKIKYISFTFY